ncbi:hypothetical protein NC651_018732 [Populus alba x Populus x berolinensis]|nr:hypothetical protein NC651_018732 [Populus alba x Populus x berolinensis]
MDSIQRTAALVGNDTEGIDDGGLGTEGIVGGSGGNLTNGGSGKLGVTVKPRILRVGGRR